MCGNLYGRIVSLASTAEIRGGTGRAAKVMAFLVSEESRYVTRQIIGVDI
jgi:NAD(P)-dependent dehydrogenase (short-subunit alcohol dehydrogenase family)